MRIHLSFLLVLVLFSCDKDNSFSEKRDDQGIMLAIPLDGSLQNPAFSPDGKAIVFTLFARGYNKEPSEIYKYSLTDSTLTLLVKDGSGNVNLPGSAWNGITHMITFSSSREPHDEIFLIPDDGKPGDEIRVTSRAGYVAYEPSLSPDGEWVVFESHRLDVENNGVIIKYKTDGSSSYVALTDEADDCRQPNWSPTGERIVYQKLENGQWDLWVMDPDGNNKFRVTSGPGDKTDASFSGDGQYIIFSTDFELDLANIYKIRITGGDPVRLTRFGGYDGAPSLSPDGTQLVFESCNDDPDGSSGTRLFLLR
jgi:TolB protein